MKFLSTTLAAFHVVSTLAVNSQSFLKLKHIQTFIRGNESETQLVAETYQGHVFIPLGSIFIHEMNQTVHFVILVLLVCGYVVLVHCLDKADLQ